MSRGPGIYRFTSIGRPIDPAYASNRAVLWLMPVGAVLFAALRWYASGADAGLGSAAITGLLLVFGAWALARELAPDDNPAAFLATAIAFVAAAFVGSGSLLLVFVALFLVRIVNRSTGLAPSPVSRCDVTDDILDPARIRGGMLVGWLVALQALFAGAIAPVMWACLAAVAVRFLAAALRPTAG